MSRRLASSLLCSLLLSPSLGCDPSPAEPSESSDDPTFRRGWGSGNMNNTFLLLDGSVAGVVRRDLQSPSFLHSPGASASIMLEWVDVETDEGRVLLDEVWADEDGLHGIACMACIMGAQAFDGPDFVGARFEFVYQVPEDPPQHLTARIAEWDDTVVASYRFVDDAHPDPDAPDAQVCASGSDGGSFASVYQDLDVNLITGDLTSHKFFSTLMFACHSAAIGKVEHWGWGRYSSDFDRQTHEAATRVVRADYCGDGNSWTTSGIQIYIQDIFGVHPFAAEHVSAELEAIWDMDGAICVNTPRNGHHDASDVICDGVPIPVCDPSDDLGTYPGAVFSTKIFEPALLGE